MTTTMVALMLILINCGVTGIKDERWAVVLVT